MSQPPTNILLIQSDQQRRDSLGCYGNEIVRTPAIDRLAAAVCVQNIPFHVARGISDLDAHHEPVQLVLGKRVSPLVLQRILRRQD